MMNFYSFKISFELIIFVATPSFFFSYPDINFPSNLSSIYMVLIAKNI